MSRGMLLLAQRLRRDAVQLALWTVATVGLAALSYVGVRETFGTEDDRTNLLAAAIANPVILLFRGLPSGTGEGAFITFLILPFLAMLGAFMSSFLAVRHTRAEEEQGRAELVAATPAGRMLPLAVTVAHGVIANAVLAGLVAASLLVLGLDGTGSLVVGVATGATGVVFLGVALLGAQLVRTSRTANALAVWAILLTYLACGIGNALGTPDDGLTRIESSWLAWVSPFGWAENTRAFDTDDLAPLLISLGFAALCTGVAFVIQSRRDLGGSLLPERLGPASAGATLGGPLGLVWHLGRGAMLGWVLGGLLVGVLSTRLASIISDVGTEVPAVQAIAEAMSAGGSLAQGAVVIFFTLVGVLASCAAVQAIGRARQEEVRGTAEPVLAAAVGRVRWLTGYGLAGFAGIAATVAAALVGAIVGLATLDDADWSLLGDAAVTGTGQVAAAAVFLAATGLVFVVLPRATIVLGWTFVLAGTIVGLFGPLFGLPDAVVHLSPIAATPAVTPDGVDPRGLVWLVLIAAAGAAASLVLMRRRELATDG